MVGGFGKMLGIFGAAMGGFLVVIALVVYILTPGSYTFRTVNPAPGLLLLAALIGVPGMLLLVRYRRFSLKQIVSPPDTKRQRGIRITLFLGVWWIIMGGIGVAMQGSFGNPFMILGGLFLGYGLFLVRTAPPENR